MKFKDYIYWIGMWIITHPIISIVLLIVAGLATYFLWKAILAIVLFILFSIVGIFAIIGVMKTGKMSHVVRTIFIILVPIIMIMSVVSVYKQVGIMEYNPETNSYSWWVGMGRYYVTGGQTDVNGNTNELLDSDRYVTSWKSDGLSEKIVAIAYNEYSYSGILDTTNHVCNWAEWKVYLDPNANWDNPAIVSTPSNPNPDVIVFLNHPETGYANPGRLPGGEYSTHEVIMIRGSYAGWYVRVIFRFQLQGIGSTRTREIHDDAQLLDGSGNVVVSYPYDDAAQEGETVTFYVTANASGPSVGNYSAGWSLTLYYPDNYPDNAGQIVKKWSIPDNVKNYPVTWTVPPGAWKPNIHPYQIVLYNSLIDQSQSWVVVVDNRSRMPPPPTITAPKWVNVSQQVVANISAYPNEITNLPINHISFAVWYGDESQNDYIIYWKDVYNLQHIGDAYVYSFTFTPTKPAIVTIGARAYDTEGRIGEIGYTSINVGKYTPPGKIYIPGQTLKYHLDSQHKKTLFQNPPTRILYQFVAPNGKVIYEIRKSPKTYYETAGYWHVTDDVSWVVPAFAEVGTWEMRIYVGSSKIPFTGTSWTVQPYRFEVQDASLGIDMFAPLYYHHKGFLGLYTINWKLPPPAAWLAVIGFIIGIVIWQRERIIHAVKRKNEK